MLANQGMYYLVSGTPPPRTGPAHPSLAPYQPFAASDGPVIIAVGNDRQFVALCDFLQLEAMATDPRYATNPARNANRETLIATLEAAIAPRTRAELLHGLPAVGVAAAAVNEIDDAFDEPQVIHRQRRIEVPHAYGSAPGIANPLHFSASPVHYPKGPPLLGEDTDTVLRTVLGSTDEQLAAWRANGVI